ncbi:MAG: DUF4260 domain-containing protein [Candidatus Dormibacteraeota bacterium]|nr:DUF4260 domain-containing protein [Candidatus Dormibacteraeota bacterium]
MKRLAYAALGFIVTGLAITVVATQHASWWQLVAFAIAPDSRCSRGCRAASRGQLHPRAVPIYNAVHRYWAPSVLVVITYFLHSPEWLAAGLAWTAHISFDRSLGFGLRTPEGFQRA